MEKVIKLSEFAKLMDRGYMTVWVWWKKGMLNAYKLPSGAIVVDEKDPFKRDLTQYEKGYEAKRRADSR